MRIRARIEEYDKKTLIIKDIPYGVTTTGLIESIIKANDKGKIKIRKVVDNTARDVEILVSLAPNQSPDITIDALYAFTDCEVSISPNACVIIDEKPRFLDVHEILEISTRQTVALLKRELEIKRDKLLEKILFSSLEKIFIENRIYRDIEECETWEAVIETIDKGLEPYKSQLYRVITGEDIVRLTEIRIKRISRYDSFKADELLKKLEEELKETERHLAHLTEFAIRYFRDLLEKYGKGRERKTEIRAFDSITAAVVAANNARLYVNRKEGFIGHGIRKDEFISECSDIDDVIVFHALARDQVSDIARNQLALLQGRLAERRVTLDVTPAALEQIARQGYDPVFGARPLKRLIREKLETPLARMLIAGDVEDGQTVTVEPGSGGDLRIAPVESAAAVN